MSNISPGLILLLLGASNAFGGAVGVSLGTAGSFAVLAASTVTNTGNTVLAGSLGVEPGTAITGFGPGIVTEGTTYTGGPVAAAAENDLMAAYNFAAGEACPAADNLSGDDLGGLTMTPGVYCFSSSAVLTGTLTLDAQGDPNAVFVFQVMSALTVAGNSSLILTNDAQGGNVFWQVGSSATLGMDAALQGAILAYSSITLNTGASLTCGSALAMNGAVTLDSNDVSACSAPEPGSGWLLSGAALLGLIAGCWEATRAIRGGRMRVVCATHGEPEPQ
jgi:type VI secretion system secreted protein VgrG